MTDRTSSATTIEADRSDVMAIIADLPAYPQWAQGITKTEVLAAGTDGRPETVRMTIEAGPIKDTYALAYEWRGERAVSWWLAERGKVITGMTGSYRLDERDAGGTEVTYELAVDVSIPMPGVVKRKAEKTIIDTALKGLKKRVER